MDLRTILHTAIDEGLSRFANTLLGSEDRQRLGWDEPLGEDYYSATNENPDHDQRHANVQYPTPAKNRKIQDDITQSAPIQKRRRSNSFADHTQTEENLGPAASKRRKTTKTIMDPPEHGHEPRSTVTRTNVPLSEVVESVESSHNDRTKRWVSTLPADPECPRSPEITTANGGTDISKEMPNAAKAPILGKKWPSKDCDNCQNWVKYYKEACSAYNDLRRRYEDYSRITDIFVVSGVYCDCMYDQKELRLRELSKVCEYWWPENISSGFGLENQDPHIVMQTVMSQYMDDMRRDVPHPGKISAYLYLKEMGDDVCDVCKGWQTYFAEQILTQDPEKYASEFHDIVEKQVKAQDHEKLPRIFEKCGLECSCTEETKMKTLEASLRARVPSQNVNFDDFKGRTFGQRSKSPEAFITPRASKTGVCGYCKRYERYWKDVHGLSDNERRVQDLQRVPRLFTNGPTECTCTDEGERHKWGEEPIPFDRFGPLDQSPEPFLREHGDFYPASGRYRAKLAAEKAAFDDDDCNTV